MRHCDTVVVKGVVYPSEPMMTPPSQCWASSMDLTSECSDICSKEEHIGCIRYNDSPVSPLCRNSTSIGSCEQDGQGCSFLCLNPSIFEGYEGLLWDLGRLHDENDDLLFNQIKRLQIPNTIETLLLKHRGVDLSAVTFYKDSFITDGDHLKRM